jgi:hypothetical protein
MGVEHEKVPPRRVDKIRLQIMGFINENFAQVEPLVQSCPAKTREKRACFRCTDVQVIDCALNNPLIFKNPVPISEEPEMTEVAIKTHAEWVEIFQPSNDPATKKIGTDALRHYGIKATDYMSLKPEARADLIMSKQPQAEKPAAKAAATTSSKKEPATAAATGGGGGGVDPKAIAKLEARFDAIEERLNAQDAMQNKLHDLLVVICLSDEKIKDNAEGLGVELNLLGNS